MKIRNVEALFTPPSPHFVGDGFRVHNYIPGVPRLNMQRMSPFIMLDYNAKYEFPPSKRPKGVGVHPHRGFETVTIAYEGSVAHGDSYGNHGVIRKGDVQWMTAASGVLHKEYHEEEFSKKGGTFQMVQLWVNLPAKDKMSPPKYQDIKHEAIPKVQLGDGISLVEVIAGEYRGTRGVASTFTPVHMMNARLKKGGKAEFDFPAHFNTIVLVVEGAVTINGETVKTDSLALMKNEEGTFNIEAMDDAIALVLSGEPIDEPIAAHGPFVMNTHQEILQAFQDYNLGKFGYLEDEYEK